MGSVANVGGGLLSGGPMGAIGAWQSQAGADRAANASMNAAIAAQREANIAYGEVSDIVKPATVAGLAQLDKDIKSQEKNLARQEQLISQIDPTIIEASQQALRLLRGEQSSTLAPIQNQRAQQRQKLLNSLREQLGPGAETSTAGIQALTKFDSETNNLLAGQQQQALGQLGNISGQFTAQRPDMLREILGVSNLGQAKTNLSFDQAKALNQARQGIMNTAGGEYVGDIMRGQYQQGMGNRLYEAGVKEQEQGKQAGASLFAMFSDRRLKKDIVKLNFKIGGVPAYSFRYIDAIYGQGTNIGVMAQDLLEMNPNHPAVSQDSSGYYKVNYGAL